MAENTNIGLTVEAWASIVVERWETQIARLNIGHSGNLINSFAHHIITQSQGNPERIEFAFEYYGKFVDMGVGRGVTMDQVEFSERRRKPWYSPVFFSQVKKLGEILADKYARKAQLMIITNVEKFDEQGGKLDPARRSSGSQSSSIDSVTGNKKMSYREFVEQNKNKSWWKGGNG